MAHRATVSYSQVYRFQSIRACTLRGSTPRSAFETQGRFRCGVLGPFSFLVRFTITLSVQTVGNVCAVCPVRSVREQRETRADSRLKDAHLPLPQALTKGDLARACARSTVLRLPWLLAASRLLRTGLTWRLLRSHESPGTHALLAPGQSRVTRWAGR
eukprot:scaffold101527_cov63-Phaeocystis_antarctica.AAC.3